jgi:hypothetical protein
LILHQIKLGPPPLIPDLKSEDLLNIVGIGPKKKAILEGNGIPDRSTLMKVFKDTPDDSRISSCRKAVENFVQQLDQVQNLSFLLQIPQFVLGGSY